MPRWIRVIRGMIGTGLTFATGVGVASSVLGLAGLAIGELSGRELVQMVGKFSVVAFIVGVAFSSVLALVARGRSFDRLSLRYVTALGAGGGMLYFVFIAAMNGARVWTASAAVLNFAVLVLLGAGAAAGMLLVARRARSVLAPGDAVRGLAEGQSEVPVARGESEERVDR